MAPVKRWLQLLVVVTVAVAAGEAMQRVVAQFHQDRSMVHRQQTNFRPEHPHRGYVGNCNNGYYNVSWEPRDLDPADRIHIYAGLVSPVDLEELHVVGQLMYEGSPMVSIDKVITCAELTQQLASAFKRDAPTLDCPVRKGQYLSGSYLYTDTEVLIGYDGFFELHALIKDKHGNELLCVDLKVNILSPDY